MSRKQTDTKEQPTKMQALEIPLKDLIPTPDNNRFIRNDERMQSLAESVATHGVLQPVIARPHPKKAGKYDLRAGARRLEAAKQAKLETIPVIVREMTDQEALEITVIENLEREDLHPLEEALGVEKLVKSGMDYSQIGARLGRPTSWVARRARLTSLIEGWRVAALARNAIGSTWSAAHLELIARLPAETQNAALDDLDPDIDQVGTVADLRVFLGQFTRSLDSMPWRSDDALLLPEVGACSECTKHTGAESQQFLFDEDELAGRTRKQGQSKRVDQCLDSKCYERKLAAHLVARKAELAEKHGQPPVLLKETGMRVCAACAEAFGKTAVESWHYDAVKKGTPGAVPALFVSGGSTGRERWVKPTGQATRGSSARAKGANGKPSPVPLKERRAKLQRRRDALVLKRVQEKLDSYTPDEARQRVAGRRNLVASLAVAFGIDEGAAWAATDCDGDPRCFPYTPWQLYDELQAAKGEGQDMWLGAVLLGVCAIWANRLSPQVGRDSANGRFDELLTEAGRMCEILGFDFDGIVKEVAAELPEPAAWSKLEADGTPKSNKPKAKQAKSTPKKPAPGRKRASVKKPTKTKKAPKRKATSKRNKQAAAKKSTTKLQLVKD